MTSPLEENPEAAGTGPVTPASAATPDGPDPEDAPVAREGTPAAPEAAAPEASTAVEPAEEFETIVGTAPEPARPSAWARLTAAVRAPEPEAQGRTERQIRDGFLSRLVSPVHEPRWLGWTIAAVVTVFATVLRLVQLGRPDRLVFDETYYVKQAYSLIALGYEGRWAEDPNLDFAAGIYTDLSTNADYVVHGPVGKWMMTIGLRLFGYDNPFGWRFSGAIIGALMVFMLVRIGRRLLGSSILGGIAGLLLAVDGIHLVMSRIGILDIFVAFWGLAGFAALLLDRDQYRRRLARRAAAQLYEHGRYPDPWGPKVGVRWWLIVAGICLGLACGVKWSGIYYVAVFGVVAVAWNITARRAVGVRYWVGGGALRDGVPAFLALVPTAALTYLASWIGWFREPDAYMRHWAQDVNAIAEVPKRTWMPDALNSWWQYHLNMWQFHTHLTSPHPYQSSPLGWLIQYRPTSFAWRDVTEATGARLVCDSDRCASAILAVGNPVIWWGAVFALLVVLWFALRHRDWRAWAILAGYAAGYLPWMAYLHRTIFTFYTVAFVPFVVLALTYALGKLIGPKEIPVRDRRPGIWVATGIVVAALLAGAFYWPIWTNQWIPYWYWHLHILLPTWV